MTISQVLAAKALEATNPQTAEERLNALAAIAVLRPLVAANPNTALTTLLKLASDYPREFLANPALPLHLLVQPDLPQHLPELALAQIVALPQVPAIYLRAARRSRSRLVQDVITDHVGFDGTDFPDWEQLATIRIRKRLSQIAFAHYHKIREDRLTEEFLAIRGIAPWAFTILAHHRSSNVRSCVAQHPDTPTDVLIALAETRAPRRTTSAIQSLAMCHARMTRESALRQGTIAIYAQLHPEERYSPAQLVAWAQHPADAVRQFVAGHPHTPPDTLAALAQTTNVLMLRALAANPATPPTMLRELAASTTDPIMTDLAAANPALPATMLEALSYDPRAQVSVARNPAIPAPVAERLARSRSQPVLMALVCNPTISLALLRALLLDQHLIHNARIRSVLLRQKLPAAVFTWDNQSEGYLHFVALHPDAPEAVLRSIARHKSIGLRKDLARNPATPPDVLAFLATDPAYRSELLQNPAAPHDFLRAVAPFATPAEQLIILQRQGLPLDIVQRIEPAYELDVDMHKPVTVERHMLSLLFTMYAHSSISPDVRDAYFCYVIWKLQPYHDWLCRFALLTSSFAPAPALDLGATSFDWLDRVAVALHPTTSEMTLRTLAASDVSGIVRAAAQATLAERAQFAQMAVAAPPTIDAILASLRYATVAPPLWRAAAQQQDVRIRDALRDHMLTQTYTHNESEAAALARIARRSLYFTTRATKHHDYFSDQAFRVVRDLPDWFIGFCVTYRAAWLRTAAATYRRQGPEFDLVLFGTAAEDRAYTLQLVQKFMHDVDFVLPGAAEALVFRLADLPEAMAQDAFRALLAQLPPFTYWFRRFTILSSLCTPPLILQQESGSPDWMDRYAIVRNPRTPVTTRQRLAREDGNCYVRAAARMAP